MAMDASEGPMLKKQWTKSTAKNCLPAQRNRSEDYTCTAEKSSTFKAAYSQEKNRGVLT
jgi:hypothetical protein